MEEANKLKERTAQCFDAAARATGCTHTLEWTYDYKNVVVHDALAAVFQAYMQDHEDFPMPTVKEAWGASTDFVSDMDDFFISQLAYLASILI